MSLLASKFATAKIECSFEIGNWTPLGGGGDYIYFAGDGTLTYYEAFKVKEKTVSYCCMKSFRNGLSKNLIAAWNEHKSTLI